MDGDLEKIRQARLQQLQSSNDNANGTTGSPDRARQESQQAEEARAHILNQILEPSAADRLGRIRMVKAEKADDVENRLIAMARSGQLSQRVSDSQLVRILESYNSQLQQQQQTQSGSQSQGDAAATLGGIRVQRKGGWDDDELDDLLNQD